MLQEGALSQNEESAIICISLCALALEISKEESTIQYSYKLLQTEASFGLSKVFSRAHEAPLA